MQMLTHQDLSTAIRKIKDRHEQAAECIREIEGDLTQNLIDYANGDLSEAEMNELATELAMLREIVQEDNREALDHFHRISQRLSEQQQHEQAQVEALARRREFAEKYNFILSRTHSPTPKEVEEVVILRQPEITGPMWHRFNSRRFDFAAQPETGRTFGEFAELELFNPET